MRVFNFKAKNIGDEKYLTYIMGEETELDEEVLDYWEDNKPVELLDVIYEEDDDYDYLTFDITGKVSLEENFKKAVDCETVLFILRNIANNLISIKEQAIPLSYVLLNRDFIYVGDNYEIKFICLPVENKGSLATEFKGFVRQLLANLRYNVDEDLNYVGKLLSYINSDAFNLRGLIGLSEALMEEAGISYEEAGAIEAEDGVEVVNYADEEPIEPEKAENFMDALGDADVPLPEIGDDEEDTTDEENEVDDEELESILPSGMSIKTETDDDIEEITEEPEIAEEETEEELEAVEEVAEEESEAVEEETAEEEPEAVEEETAEEEPETVGEETAEEEPEAVEEEIEEEEPKAVEEEIEEEEPKAVEEKIENKTKTAPKKETDVNLIKSRIMELVGEVPSAKTKGGEGINSIRDLDEFLDSKPPVIKKNVVKVNRAAIIQNVAAAEQETEELSVEEAAKKAKDDDIKVPVIEEMYDDMNIEQKKPKSNSVLSKTVEETSSRPSIINVPKANPYLIRVNTDERIMLTKISFKIGKANRGVDYTVSGNGAISRQHAIIIQRDGVCYIKDNKSTNHTYVNGRKVEDGEEEILTHDSMIKLGDEEFLFKIR